MLATWNFIKNNKKTIFFATSAVAGFIGLRKYFSTLEKQWEHSQSKSFVSEVHKKGTYFDEALCIGNNMANKQLGLVIKKLKEIFNIVKLLNKIKTAQMDNMSASKQLKYYEELKIEIFTYIVSEIYSIAFLITYLRVQLSMISGVMYYENRINHSTGNKSRNVSLLKDTTSRYFMFMSLLENFHQKGISHLVETIRKCILNSFGKMKVTDKVTLKDVLENFKEVKADIQKSYNQLIEENVLLVYCSNREQIFLEETSENKMLNELKACSKFVDEMIDITKLPDFCTVIENCIDIGFSNLFDFIGECFIQFETQNFNTTKDAQNDSIEKKEFINPHQINVLLIKLLPLIWTQVHDSVQQEEMNQQQMEFTDRKNNRNALLVQYLLCSDSLTCFTANIYEAFCNEK